jgi:hypothetical protein
MKYTGMTLNLLTLCGLTLGVGMLVDNSIVVLENIYSMNQRMKDSYHASIEGSKQVFLSVAASTLTSVVVYLPIALSTGYAGMVFKDFSFTIIFALLASLVVSMTVVPMLCSKILSHDVHTDYMRIGKHHYRYRFDVSFYDKKSKSFLDPIEFCIELSDEEYIQLLAERLLVPCQFCYNRIVLTLPRIAQHITEYVHDWCYHNYPTEDGSVCPPFMVHFTEIDEDAKAIEAKY